MAKSANVEGRANGGLNTKQCCHRDYSVLSACPEVRHPVFVNHLSIISLARTAYSYASVAALLGSRVVVHGDLIDGDFVQSKVNASRQARWKRERSRRWNLPARLVRYSPAPVTGSRIVLDSRT